MSSGLTAAICTRNRPQQLHRALVSLTTQKTPASEILVIDNAPATDSTRLLVERNFPTVRYVLEPVPGLDFARNRALRESATDIVAFLDDDAVAHENWCEAISKVFAENPDVAACTGRVDALTLETEAQRLFEANGGFSRGDTRIRLPRDHRQSLHGWRAPLIAWAVSIGCGCSFALRRKVALDVGGFDEALDMGPPLLGGGDLDMLWRLLDAGCEVLYAPEARAWHEHRRDMSGVFDQIVGHQRALLAFLGKNVGRKRANSRLPVLLFLGWRLLKPGVRLLRRVAGRDPLPAKVLARMWWNCWLGVPMYLVARRIARRRVAQTMEMS